MDDKDVEFVVGNYVVILEDRGRVVVGTNYEVADVKPDEANQKQLIRVWIDKEKGRKSGYLYSYRFKLGDGKQPKKPRPVPAIEVGRWVVYRNPNKDSLFEDRSIVTKVHESGRFVITDKSDGVWISKTSLVPAKDKAGRYLPLAKKVPAAVEAHIGKIMAADRGKNHGCADWIELSPDGEVRKKYSQACHAGFGYAHRGPVKEMYLLVSAGAKAYGDWYKQYISYAVERSSFKDVFLPVDNLFAENAKVDVEKNVDELVAAAVLLRQASEYRSVVEPTWKFFKEKGFSDTVAFGMCQVVCLNGKVWSVRTPGGHTSFDTQNSTWEGLVHFLKNGFTPRKGLPPFSTGKGSGYQISRTIAPWVKEECLQVLFSKTGKKVGSGWDSVFSIPEESILEFAKKLEEAVK